MRDAHEIARRDFELLTEPNKLQLHHLALLLDLEMAKIRQGARKMTATIKEARIQEF